MKEQNILRWVIPAIAVSLLGLGALQIVLLRDTYQQKEQAFGKNVLSAMQQVTRLLETREAQIKVSKLIRETNSGHRMMVVTNSESYRSPRSPDSVSFKFNFLTTDSATDSVYVKDGMVYICRSLPELPERRLSDTTIVKKGKDGVLVKQIVVGGGSGSRLKDSTSIFMENMDHTVNRIYTDSLQNVRREELIASVFDVLAEPEKGEVEHGVKPGVIDSLLRSSFNESGVDIPFAFGIKSGRGSSLRYVSDSNSEHQLKESEFTASLFPAQFLSSNSRLVVYFPGRQIFLLREIAPSVLATVIFMVVILGSFVYTIRTIYRQKQFAGRLTDFINNITHEFKTPLSTISVVTDTLANPDVICRTEKVQQYNAIIRDEAGRLKTHVDKILQLAVLEEGDYEFNMSDIDANGLIREAVERFTIQVEKRQGIITTSFETQDATVHADPYHFNNIVLNLLDNADKYSPENPIISVRTVSDGKNFRVEVTDKGIGISREDQAHLFEKYYRVSTRNRHDVKGFGLGLSYVKLTVDAHGGNVQVLSALGEGTSVVVSFPLAEK